MLLTLARQEAGGPGWARGGRQTPRVRDTCDWLRAGGGHEHVGPGDQRAAVLVLPTHVQRWSDAMSETEGTIPSDTLQEHLFVAWERESCVSRGRLANVLGTSELVSRRGRTVQVGAARECLEAGTRD